jgi:hypothetical protein
VDEVSRGGKEQDLPQAPRPAGHPIIITWATMRHEREDNVDGVPVRLTEPLFGHNYISDGNDCNSD